MTFENLNSCVELINVRVAHFRHQIVVQNRILLGYTIGGFLLTCALATAIGFYGLWPISIILIVLFFTGLYYLEKRTSKIIIETEKILFFNLAIVLHNLNQTKLCPVYKIRARIGHIG